MKNRILYEDNHLIIVNKLPSEIVQGDKTGDESLAESVKKYIKIKYEKPGDVFLGVVHRIDRPVSGAVIFARTSKALTRLNEMIRDRNLKKIYWAVVKNRPPAEEGTLVNFIRKNEEKNKAIISNFAVSGSQEARLIYWLKSTSDNYTLLEVELLTGRHHQIRAQLAYMGCPIKGDLKYGYPRSNSDASIHLHAIKLEFMHPVKKEMVQVIAPPPNDPVWNYFYHIFYQNEEKKSDRGKTRRLSGRTNFRAGRREP